MFLKLITKKFLPIACAALFVPSAMAGVVTYDFTEGVGKWGQRLGSTTTFTEQDLDLTVTSYVRSGWGWRQGRDVYQDGWAYGAKGLGVYGGWGDNFEIDGWGRDEGLHFGFDDPVELLNVTTWFGDSNDDWDLVYQDDAGHWAQLLDSSRIASYDTNVITDSFFIYVDGSNDSITVKQIEVGYNDKDPEPVVSVSEPGVFGLMAIGLLGLFAQRRAVKS